ncbi:MAG: ParB/RepB/Spo0J family partition protein [Clostridia bacterium]
MKNSGRNISLNAYEDIFSTEEIRQEARQETPVTLQKQQASKAPLEPKTSPLQEVDNREKVQMIPLSELHPFHEHPFKVKDDEEMANTVDSVKQYGVLVPAIARPMEGGGYELVAGHRRHHASELAGLSEMPVIVRKLDDDAATIIMVDSNLQRENILPSERAFAYKMKLSSMKSQVGRPTRENVSQVGTQKRSDQIMAEQVGDSRNQIQRFIRLTALVPQLLDMVDTKKIAFNPAVELSYLKQTEQHQLLGAMESEQSTPSLSQAQRLKKFSQEEKLTPDMMIAIMSEEKKPEQDKLTFTGDKLRKFFPKTYTPQQMEQTIFKLLEQWQRRRQQDLER